MRFIGEKAGYRGGGRPMLNSGRHRRLRAFGSTDTPDEGGRDIPKRNRRTQYGRHLA